MKNFDAIIIGTGQAGPSLAARFAIPMSNGAIDAPIPGASQLVEFTVPAPKPRN